MAIDPKDLSIHDDVLVETEVDGIPISLPSFVTNVLDKELWLALRLPDPRLLRIEEGQRIHLTFDRGGALIVESEFVRRLGGSSRMGTEKSRVFAVRRPQGVDQVQRRAHVRVDLERDVRIKSFGALAADMVGAGRTVNIGAGGVQFTTEMPLMFGDQLRVALVLTARDIVVAGGPVVRIDEIPAPVPPGSEAPTGQAQDAHPSRGPLRQDHRAGSGADHLPYSRGPQEPHGRCRQGGDAPRPMPASSASGQRRRQRSDARAPTPGRAG